MKYALYYDNVADQFIIVYQDDEAAPVWYNFTTVTDLAPGQKIVEALNHD